MAETWIINESPSMSDNRLTSTINFISNNVSYKIFYVYPWGQGHSTEQNGIVYFLNDVWGSFTQAYLTSNNSWTNQAYRTVTFETSPTGELLTWLQSNATLIPSTTTYEHIKYNANKIQVDSAIRDGIGRKIETTYATKGELGVPTMTISLSQVVSQSPLQIALTEEQQSIYLNPNTSMVCVDLTALGFDKTYVRRWLEGTYVTENSDSIGNGISYTTYYESDDYDYGYVEFTFYYYTDYKNSSNTNLGTLKFVKLTQDEFDDLVTKDTNTMYIIVNETSGGSN